MVPPLLSIPKSSEKWDDPSVPSDSMSVCDEKKKKIVDNSFLLSPLFHNYYVLPSSLIILTATAK